MTQWFVKDLSKLTGVTVQTLHHYDRIDLLKPSLRRSNGYRVYSEKDLLKLQQIIALKFFGFELSQIKTMLDKDSNALAHFSNQVKVLEHKANALFEASNTLKNIINSVKSNKSIPWETIIQLIEVYKMTENLDQNWVREIFTPEELKQYVTFENELKTKATLEQKAAFEKNWANLVEEIRSHLNKDPSGPIGIHLGKKMMDWVNGVYGKENANLRTKIWEQGYGEGKGLEEVGLTPELVSWMDKAMDAYWRDRVYSILNQVGKEPEAMVLRLWNAVLDDMYGTDDTRKKDIYSIVLNDDKVSLEAKAWLKSFLN
jgi:DNA-binding transcriptional MerR regulator